MSDQATKDMSTMYFKDVVFMKQFLEKGFREGFFNQQELPMAKMTHTKLSLMITEVLKSNKKENV